MRKSKMPLAVRALDNGTYVVKNNGKETLPGFSAVQVRGGKVRFQTYGPLAGGTEVTARETQEEFSPDADKLGDTVARMLVAAGVEWKEGCRLGQSARPHAVDADRRRRLYLPPAALLGGLVPMPISGAPNA